MENKDPPTIRTHDTGTDAETIQDTKADTSTSTAHDHTPTTDIRNTEVVDKGNDESENHGEWTAASC